MDGNITPYLCSSGLTLDFNSLHSATSFVENIHLADDKQFTNGMMLELRKYSGVSLTHFYDFIKSIVPTSLLTVMDSFNKNTFKSKIQVFDKHNTAA